MERQKDRQTETERSKRAISEPLGIHLEGLFQEIHFQLLFIQKRISWEVQQKAAAE